MTFGYGLKHYKTLVTAEQTTAAITAPTIQKKSPPLPEAVSLPVEVSKGSASLKVNLFNRQGSLLRQTSGILLTENRYLVLPLASLVDSYQVQISLNNGDKQLIGQPFAIDTSAGLALWKLDLINHAYYPLVETDALFSGKEFVVKDNSAQSSGLVLSIAYDDQEDVNSLYFAKIPNQQQWLGAALLDPDSNELIGLVINNINNDNTYSVLQTSSLINLLEELPDESNATLAQASTFYYTRTALGQLQRITQLTDDQQWQEALLKAKRLNYQHPQYKDRVLPLMKLSFTNLINQATELSRPQLALRLINQANAALGTSTERLITRTNILNEMSLHNKAITSLKSALLSTPEQADLINQLIRKTVFLKANNLAEDEKEKRISIIKQALQDDPNFDQYHRYLGKLYLSSGKFDDALHHLNSAVILNEQLYDELTPLINLAANNQSGTTAAEVPLQISNNNIFVSVKINDDSTPLRFVLDTGASFTALSAQTAASLGITTANDSSVLNLETANGPIQAPLVTVDSIALSSVRIENTDVVILDTLRGADGLLGISFLKHFEFNINQSESTLTLNRRSLQ